MPAVVRGVEGDGKWWAGREEDGSGVVEEEKEMEVTVTAVVGKRDPRCTPVHETIVEHSQCRRDTALGKRMKCLLFYFRVFHWLNSPSGSIRPRLGPKTRSAGLSGSGPRRSEVTKRRVPEKKTQ